MESIIIKALAAKKTKEFILAHPEYKLNFWQHCREKYFFHLRRKGFSIAYIAGHKEFCGLDFLVNKHTLIPRPETELLVEEALHVILSNSEESLQPSILIDVGTGTGCIPIAISKKITGATIFASDISRSALRVARKNAKKHGVQINFLHGDLLKPFFKQNNNLTIQSRRSGRDPDFTSGQFNNSTAIITANLPYLTEKQFISESSIQREPKHALVADNQDGLSLYKKLLEQIKSLKFSGISIFLEIDPSQNQTIKKIVGNIFPKAIIEIKNDLAGRDRLVVIHIN